MSKKHNGGPAFPGLNPAMTGIDSDGFERWETEPSGGMSLRDYFAARAPHEVPKWFKHESKTSPPSRQDVEKGVLKDLDEVGREYRRHEPYRPSHTTRQVVREEIEWRLQVETEEWKKACEGERYFAWRWHYADMMLKARGE